MWFNSTQRAEPYQLLTCLVWGREIGLFSSAGRDTGVAWLSSARVVRCWVKSRNERNPYCVLYHSHGTAERNSEEGGDDVKSAWPLRPGLHPRYNGRYNGQLNREVELIPKAGLSSDRRLQLAFVKPELL